MAVKTQKRHNRTYYENNCIEAMILDNKSVCPLCRIQPVRILECISKDGKIIFYKHCQSCKGVVKIEKNSMDI